MVRLDAAPLELGGMAHRVERRPRDERERVRAAVHGAGCRVIAHAQAATLQPGGWTAGRPPPGLAFTAVSGHIAGDRRWRPAPPEPCRGQMDQIIGGGAPADADLVKDSDQRRFAKDVLEASRTLYPGTPALTPNAVKAILQYSALRLRGATGAGSELPFGCAGWFARGVLQDPAACAVQHARLPTREPRGVTSSRCCCWTRGTLAQRPLRRHAAAWPANSLRLAPGSWTVRFDCGHPRRR